MPKVNPNNKLVAKTFRKLAVADLRLDDTNRVWQSNWTREKRLAYIRDMHRAMLDIESKKSIKPKAK